MEPSELNEEEKKELKQKIRDGDIDEELLASPDIDSLSDDLNTINVMVTTVNIYVELSTGKRVTYSGVSDECECCGEVDTD